MDAERALEQAIARLAPKMPADTVFKRSECLARIRELHQSLSDSTVVDEFVRIVSHDPRKYVEGVSPNLERSSAPEATGQDPRMPLERGQPMPQVMDSVRSAAPSSPASDDTMPVFDPQYLPYRSLGMKSGRAKVTTKPESGRLRRVLGRLFDRLRGA